MNKLFKKVAVSIIGFGLLLTPAVTYASTTTSTAEVSINPSDIVIEVMVNSLGKDALLNIELEDGTTVSDHNVTFIENPQSRNSPLTQHFHFVAWITRDGVISLSLDPVSAVRRTTASNMAAINAWNALAHTRTGMGSHPNWRNEGALRAQFDCHVNYATNKDFWNLEPHRTSTNAIWTAIRGCNP